MRVRLSVSAFRACRREGGRTVGMYSSVSLRLELRATSHEPQWSFFLRALRSARSLILLSARGRLLLDQPVAPLSVEPVGTVVVAVSGSKIYKRSFSAVLVFRVSRAAEHLFLVDFEEEQVRGPTAGRLAG